MLHKDVLDTQTTIELPAREMLAFWNVALVFANQQAVNYNTQVNAGGLGQVNYSTQVNANSIVIGQS